MRRTTAAVIGTLAGTALLTGLKLGTGTDAQGAGAATGDNPTAAGQGGDLGQVPATAPTSNRSAGSHRHEKAPARSATGLKDGTFVGRPSTEQYGTIRVGITVSGGRVTAVRVSYPTSPSRTASVNARAVPVLKRETLAAQSANVATVSGASYTSASFRESLQSALRAARA